MKKFLRVTAMAAGAVLALAGAAAATTCQNAGVTLTSVDGVGLAPVNATNCFGSETGNLNPAAVGLALADNDWGFGNYTWNYLGKDENGAAAGPVSAQWGQSTGTWSADFGAGNTASVFVVLLKAGNAYSSFLFDIAPTSGQTFAGGFNTQLAGLVNNKDIGQGLSHLEVAGVFTGMAPVPLPAAGWMLIAGLGGLVAMRRRRKAA